MMGGFIAMPEAILGIPGFPVKRFKSAGYYWVAEQSDNLIISPTEGIRHFLKMPPVLPRVMARTEVKFLDAHIRSYIYPQSYGGLVLRYQGGTGDAYIGGYFEIPKATADHSICKWVAGSWIQLAYEAVDLSVTWYDSVFTISGNTLKSSRDGGATYPISVTDTSITVEGYAGIREYEAAEFVPISIGAPLSPSPKVIGYFEVPVIGSGTEEDPYRANLPEQIVDGVNVLALTNSALIKTGTDGKPVEYRAIVRIFDQPDRPASLAPISQALDALRAMPGVRQLIREQAIAMAKRLDDRLHDLDLRSARELGLDRRKAGKEYMSWRIHNLGVKEELLDLEIQERYAEEDKW